MSIHFSADQDTVDTIYRIILSVNHLSIYGAVAAICDEYEGHQDTTGQPVILEGQSIVLGEVEAEVPVHDEDPKNDQIIWQQYFQQVESLSPENRLSKFCNESGFMRVVEVGQYFVTRNASEFQHTIACREFTLPRDDKASQPKGWIRGNTRIGPVLEVTTSFRHFKYGIEIRIKSVNQDDSHSWVRISYGTVRYVNDYIKYDTQSLAVPQEEEVVPTSSGVVAARSKAKAKPQPRESTGATTIPLSERVWIDIEPSKQDLESYNLSKKVINLLRHNQKLHREEDGAIQFYKIKFHLRDHHLKIQNWSDDRWIACLAAGGGSKRRYQYCSDYLGSIIYLRALQGHSGGHLIGSYITRQRVNWTWNLSLHLPCGKQFQSLFNYQQWIDTWRSEFEQNSSCLLIQEKKITKIQRISTTLHHVSHDTCKMHGRDIKIRYCGSILILESEKD